MRDYQNDRALVRTEAEREERYVNWLRYSELEDSPERRQLHFRRYQKPKAPVL